MFSTITKLWRSRALKKEVADAVDKLSRTHVQVRAICAATFLDSLAGVQHDFGPIDNLSDDQRRDLGEKFSAAGRKIFDSNVGGAYGLFLVSAYLEAPALPGPNAKAAFELATQYYRQAQAIQFVANRDEARSS